MNTTIRYSLTENPNATVMFESFYYLEDENHFDTFVLDAFIKKLTAWQYFVRGYGYFILGTLTIIGNVFLISSLRQRKKLTSTTVFLISLALSNSLVCATVLPDSFYLYILENEDNQVRSWCTVTYICYIFCQIYITISNWITVILAIQRCVIVCLPFAAKRLFSIKRVVALVIIAHISGVLCYLHSVLWIDLQALDFENMTMYDFSFCSFEFKDWYARNTRTINTAITVDYLVTCSVTTILPCVILLACTILLTVKLKKQIRVIKSIRRGCLPSKATVNLRRISMMIYWILLIFLITEINNSVALGFYIYEIVHDTYLASLPIHIDTMWKTVSTLTMILSYQGIFWIMFFMSGQFRRSLKMRLTRYIGFVSSLSRSLSSKSRKPKSESLM